MARLALLIVGVALLAGCQSPSLVEKLPAPNFNGPVISPAVAATPSPTQPPNLANPVKPPPKAGLAFDRAWVPNVPARKWEWIVIHHSATPSGGMVRFDREHREKGWDELGYHFVIGNGTDTRDGQIEIGSRWPKQKWGAHAKTPDNEFNDYGIGICLVGNFEVQNPSQKQMQSAARLVAYLQATYHIPADHIVGHGSVHTIAHAGTITDCPGRNLSVTMVRRMAGQALADAGESIDDNAPRTAASQLLQPLVSPVK